MGSNIVYFNDQLREELDKIENKSKNKDIISYIQHDDNLYNYISLIFGDAYVLLNFKNKTSIITPEEKKVLDVIENSLNNKSTIYLIAQNQPDIFNVVLKEASDFRKMNMLAKAKIFYSLNKVERGLLTIIEYLSKDDLIKYDLNEANIRTYIGSFDKKSTNLEYEIKNYLAFLSINNVEKYKEIKRNMEVYLFDLDSENNKDIVLESKTKGITIDFIAAYINSIPKVSKNEKTM